MAPVAGRPRTRAKREAELAARGVIPDAVPQLGAPQAGPTRARAHAHHRSIPLGSATRATIDAQQAETVRNIARAIRPGVVIEIERTRPTWCAGFLEAYPVEDGESLRTLREYIRDEHGGQSYVLTALLGEDVIARGTEKVAGPPRDMGRVINRAKWEGQPAEERTPAPASSSGMDGLADLIKLFVGMQADASKAQLESVRDMVKETRGQTTELMKAVVESRESNNAQQGFAAQLGQFVEASRGIDKAKRQLFGAAKREEPADELDPVEKEAKQFFTRAFLGSVFKEQGAAPQRTQQQRAPAQRNGSAAQQPNGFRIPDAKAGN